MSDDSEKCSAATPSGNLLRDLMDPRIAKSEMEWFASREIARLTAEAANWQDALNRMSDQLDEAWGERDAAKQENERLNKKCNDCDVVVLQAETIRKQATDLAAARKEISELKKLIEETKHE